ncbi:MAG TPA: SGNH/GDSL hydrolase family protein [Gammaproteobacteria bacterium]
MNYQRIACWGDSQTFGARTYGCYPMYLAQILNRRTRYRWQVLNLGENGLTARGLWLRLPADLVVASDVHHACILIGANDVGDGTPIDLFAEYYRQVLSALELHGFRALYCGEIPPLWPDGHAFFPAAAEERRDAYNRAVSDVAAEFDVARMVEFSNLTAECYTDPVHFNESGNRAVAERYAEAVMSR